MERMFSTQSSGGATSTSKGESAFVVVPPTTEVGVRDMCPSSGSASMRPKGPPKATVAMRQMTSIVEGADLRVGRSGV